MREVIEQVERWRQEGRRVALARVVGVDGSGPRDPGATMAVSEDGRVAGSVSGGCVESAVVTEAMAAMEARAGARLCSFGYSDEDAFAVGLACGGTVHVLVEPELPPVYDDLRDAIQRSEPVVLATVTGVTDAPEGWAADPCIEVGHGDAAPELGACLLMREDGSRVGSLGEAHLDEVVGRDALGALAGGLSATRHYGPTGQARQRSVEVFIEVFARPPRLIIFGGVDFTAALARLGKALGYRVTVCDARPVFASVDRFPMADEVVVDRPDRYLQKVGGELTARDAVCVLTHSHQFDVPAIVAALSTEVGYLGAMGSRRTHADRVAHLAEAGVDAESIKRVMAPIGLDIGARTPEETAVAIFAEIIALRTGRPGLSLRDRTGPIH
ncbi:MAG TPA: XdhC/CoxI family protein [Acidimicrobiales bacterium]|nr:XdhC/CoxI family protein [Acidimicrobiales bacterium]